MPQAGRVSWTAMVGFGAPCVAFGVSTGLMFYGPYPPGWTIIAILLSAFTWWLSALAAELDWLPIHGTANHLNAFAASTAAVAGLLAFDHSWQKIIDLF